MNSQGEGRSLSLRIAIYEGLSPDLYLDLENAPKKLRSERLRHLAQLGLLVATGKFQIADDPSRRAAEPSPDARYADAARLPEKAATPQRPAEGDLGGMHSFGDYFQ